MLRTIKPEIRIIGWDDAPFAFRDKVTLVAGVVCRGGTQIDGVITTRIAKDGLDATDKISDAINASSHKDQLSVIMLDGITFGGFNIVDIKRLREKTGIPVIVVIRDEPDMKAIKKALLKFPDSEKRWKLIEKAGEIRSLDVRNKVLKGTRTIYYQKAGLDEQACERIINLTAVNSAVPEPVRLAHIICSGIRNDFRR
jgi:hypothetical protein